MSEGRNVIFLDIDGVLCTPRASVAMRDGGIMSYLDPIGLGLLTRLVEDHNAKLVISSTWRLNRSFSDFYDIFKITGFSKLAKALVFEGGANSQNAWRTKSISGTTRGQEIEQWVEDYGDVAQYVILDDDSDMTDNQKENNFVKCGAMDGMSYMNFRLCCHIFEGKKLSEFNEK